MKFSMHCTSVILAVILVLSTVQVKGATTKPNSSNQGTMNGTVTIQPAALDREDTSRHQMKIVAVDDGVPPKSEIVCDEGTELSDDKKTCVDKNECLDKNLCLNGGICSNREVPYRFYCECPLGFWGQTCQLLQEEPILVRESISKS